MEETLLSFAFAASISYQSAYLQLDLECDLFVICIQEPFYFAKKYGILFLNQEK